MAKKLKLHSTTNIRAAVKTAAAAQKSLAAETQELAKLENAATSTVLDRFKTEIQKYPDDSMGQLYNLCCDEMERRSLTETEDITVADFKSFLPRATKQEIAAFEEAILAETKRRG